MKYYCMKCGSMIDECDLIVREDETDWYNPPNETWFCPYCGADENEIEDAETCLFCHEDKPPHEQDGSYFCENCREELESWWNDVIEQFSEKWSIDRDTAIEVINEYLSEIA